MRRSLRLAFATTVAFGAVASVAGASVGNSDVASLKASARFACYYAQFSVFRPQTRILVDQLARVASVSVSAPESVCAPAPGLSTSYLTCYRVTVTTSRFRPQTKYVLDEFNKSVLKLSVYSLRTLCVPSARVEVGTRMSRSPWIFVAAVPV